MASTAGTTNTSIDALLKFIYDGDALVVSTYTKNPMWALMTKERAQKTPGRSFIHPLVYASNQGRSGSFARSQAGGQSTSSRSVDFTIPRTFNYGNATVSTEALLSTMGDRAAFESAVTLETDRTLANLGLDQAISCYGDGSGSRGNISTGTTIASSVLQFTVGDSALYFEPGMELDLCATVNGTVRAYGSAGHGLYVWKVDPLQGTITIGTTPTASAAACNINDATNGIPTAAQGDFIFVRGDQGSKMVGLEGWIPPQAVSSASFFGVDRTIQQVRLAGQYLDATQMSVEEALMTAASNVDKLANGSLTHFFLPQNKYLQLMKSEAGKRVIYEEVVPGVGFEGVEMYTPAGTVHIMPDRNCPANRIWGININTWKFLYLGEKPVTLFDLDGNTWLRQVDNDGLEIRFFSFGNMVCLDPSQNINIQVAP